MARALELLVRLRTAEKVALGFLVYAVIASAYFPLSLRERLAVVFLNLASSAVLLLLGRFAREKQNSTLVALRDWFPAILILLAYRESGLFLIPDPTHRLDYLFVRWDTATLKNPYVLGALSLFSPWLEHYLELCYLLCYPLLPLGLASLLLAGRLGALDGHRGEQAVDFFWTTVLAALLTCYVLFPFFPSISPRLFFHDLPGPAGRGLFRNINLWILGKYGNAVNVFPSGHVAGVTATALAVRAYLPRIGVLFSIVAASIAVATVVGRYHYAVDALAGALIAFAAFWISTRLHRR